MSWPWICVAEDIKKLRKPIILRTAGDEITNNATTPTGDILLSTKNFAVGDNYTIIIEFR